MELKNIFDKARSYFNTDEVDDFEEYEESVSPQQTKVAVGATADDRQTQGSYTTQRTQATRVAEQPRPQRQPVTPIRTASEVQHQQTQAFSQARQNHHQEQTTTIALKYPKNYEDAETIVDLLLDNECVLIDFQYMLDAQARRCIDFINGASRVLYGNLQRVGQGTMYLLTPGNVTVNIEDLPIPTTNQDHGFDFDMKRR